MEMSEIVYRTKNVTFQGRQVPIILQNGNGPCPLIAICNLLLLRNHIALPESSNEVSLKTLLDLLGAAVVDWNCNEQNEDRIKNRLEQISTVMDSLNELATGLDVDVRFNNIRDVDFPKGCPIFNLLDISIVHGWLCDPQDESTSRALGSYTYNEIAYKLASLRSAVKPIKIEKPSDDDEVDFAAATTATLGVPSPSRKSIEGLQFPCNKSGEFDGHMFPEQTVNGWSEVEGPTTTDIENGFVSVSGSDWRDRTSESEQMTGAQVAVSDEPEQQNHAKDTEQQSHATDSVDSPRSDFECLQAENVEQEPEKPADDENDSGKNVEELLYEGEQSPYEKEPLYEGEAVLLQAESSTCGTEAAIQACLIEAFLENNKSQLTYHGLFSLQEELNNGDLVVFFRNNHFSTMFKYDGGLYLLVTDQGYINEPHVAWEKLTEVDGDSVFFTGDFELFKADEPPANNAAWNQREAVAATAEYMSSQSQADNSMDMQLALKLQEEEFDQQSPPAQQQHHEERRHQQQEQNSPRRQQGPSPRKQQGSRPSSSLSTGRLFTGGRSSSPSSPKPDHPKNKDKCRVM